jgi:AAA15 family ATPase/GTPase
MLVQFLVENFLSFKDETVFSMRAPPGETRAVTIPGHDGLRLMRAAALYGANASGKSNLVKAIGMARDLIVWGILPKATLPARPFRLAPNAPPGPTRFQFDFLVDDIRYSYVLIITTEFVTGEALYRTLPDTSNEELIYEREAPSDGGEHRIVFGPTALAGDDAQKQFAQFIAKGTPKQQPLLTEFVTRNVPGFATIHAWFRRHLAIVFPSTPYINLVRELFESSSLREFYGRMLSAMGTGVHGVRVEKEKDMGLAHLFRDIAEVFRMPKVKDVFQALFYSSVVPYIGVDVERDGEDASLFTLFMEHSTRSGPTVSFPLAEESDGTQRLIHLLPVLFHGTQGPCTVIDELDRSLHTALTRRFIEDFMAMASGAQSQLIFTTHDTNLLNKRLLPPASIWFVEKDDDGASHLHSLADYRGGQLDHLLDHLEEGYLQGRFGAIPFLANRDNLGWRSEEEESAG